MNTAIIDAIQSGQWVAVSDAVDREHEVDLVIPAQHITVEQMAFMIRHTSGIICVAMKEDRLRQLGLERLPTTNPSHFDTPFTMSVDYKPATRGGVSAQERVATVHALTDLHAAPGDFGRPGHVFPLQAHSQGLHGRQGHTEAALYLMEHAQQYPAAVIGELMNDDGTMMRGDELNHFLLHHHIPLVSINELLNEHA